MQTQHPTLDHLLAAFEQHQRLRRIGAPIATLSRSRAQLDQLRVDVRRSVRG